MPRNHLAPRPRRHANPTFGTARALPGGVFGPGTLFGDMGDTRGPPTPGAAVADCTTRFENAHGTEFRELLYRWHPWFGLQVCIHEEIDKADGGVFRCTLSDSDAARCLEVPAWMFD